MCVCVKCVCVCVYADVWPELPSSESQMLTVMPDTHHHKKRFGGNGRKKQNTVQLNERKNAVEKEEKERARE